ncbi:MAG TPA: hypothetical protein VK708_10305 [Bryobacteraceae bacterium]|nr:hypothetical protein [Bryobacteraceae bacterium]
MPKLAGHLTILIAASAIMLQAQWLNYPTPGIPRLPNGQPNFAAPAPQAPDGKPDLSGVWNRLSPKYRINIVADLKPGEIQPWAKELASQRMENFGKDSMGALCLPAGPAYTTDADSTSGGMMKIIQTPALILILNPDLTYRQIYLDGRPLEASPNPTWMGYSIGHWEADTLVVESFGFNDRTWLDTSGHPHTEALRMTERYRRRDYGHLDLEVTLQDPKVYARPWTVAVRAELAADTEMLEFVCNEKSGEREHWIGKASDQTKSEVKIAPEILAKYTGTYVEQPKLWRVVPRVVEITMSDGVLFGEIDGRGRERQFARSETGFSGFAGLAIEFVKNSQGVVTDLLVKHVSGDYRFARQR